MSKIRAFIISGIMVLVATVLMGTIYTFSNISYSYVVDTDNYNKNVEIKNVKVINKIEADRVDGPNIVDNDLTLSIDIAPYETYSFKYDIVNTTGIDYELSKLLVSCAGDVDVNNYLSISINYENGTSTLVVDVTNTT